MKKKINIFKSIGIVFLILFVLFLFGIALPYLISANNTELVIGGILIIAVFTASLFTIIYNKREKIMKIFNVLIILILAVFMFSCSKVPAGNVGVKFYLLGGDKGVDSEELSPGRYWIGFNEELYLFPTFTQNYVWTANKAEGSPEDESFNFQDIQGLELNADIGITYRLEPTKVSGIFQKYKKGIAEITDIYLRNMVRDALVKRTSKLKVEYIYGEGRSELIENVTTDVQVLCDPIGILIEKIYWIGRIKLPESVKNAIDAKIKATQIAQQRENEVREAQAQAQKKIAQAEGEAVSILRVAEAQAKANTILNRSLTLTLVQYKSIEKWNGTLPTYTGGGAVPFINMK